MVRLAKMCDSCFLPFKLHYAEMKKLATGDFVQSDVISAGGHLWSIRCYPRGKGEMDDDDSDSDDEDEVAADYLAIYLRHMTNARGIKVIFEAFVMDKNGEPSTSHARRVVHFFSSKVSKSLGWSRFLKRRNLESRYVVDGWVTIVCGVIVVPDGDHLTVPPSDIGSQLGRLLDCADDGSDVSFIVDRTTFAAHRAVLAARSPVFKVELFGPMAEASMSHIPLEDIAPATFKVFLRFIYTDILPEDDKLEFGDDGDSPVEMYKHLLAVADRYAVDRLKLMCAKKLWDNVSADTVAETLSYAETYSCAELKTKCIAFFAEDKNFREAVLTDGFVALVQKFPGIIAELRKKAKD